MIRVQLRFSESGNRVPVVRASLDELRMVDFNDESWRSMHESLCGLGTEEGTGDGVSPETALSFSFWLLHLR